MAAYRDDARKTWFVKFRYLDHNGQSKFTTKRGFKTKAEAVKYEALFKDRESQYDVSFDVVLDEFIKYKETRVKEQTIRTLHYNLRASVAKFFRGKKLSQVTPNLIRLWQDGLIRKGMKPSSINEYRAVLHNVLHFATKFYALPNNPIDMVERLSVTPSERRIWDEKAFYAFISCLPESAQKYIPVFTLLFYSGMRTGEALALEVNDIGSDCIVVNKSYGTKTRHITSPKTRSGVRTISVPHHVVDCIRGYIDEYNPKYRIFEGLGYSMIAKTLAKYSVKAGVGRQTLHGLRHSHISLLLAHGVSITAVSAHAGHANPSVTMSIYAHALSNSEQEIAKCWSNNGQK